MATEATSVAGKFKEIRTIKNKIRDYLGYLGLNLNNVAFVDWPEKIREFSTLDSSKITKADLVLCNPIKLKMSARDGVWKSFSVTVPADLATPVVRMTIEFPEPVYIYYSAGYINLSTWNEKVCVTNEKDKEAFSTTNMTFYFKTTAGKRHELFFSAYYGSDNAKDLDFMVRLEASSAFEGLPQVNTSISGEAPLESGSAYYFDYGLNSSLWGDDIRKHTVFRNNGRSSGYTN